MTAFSLLALAEAEAMGSFLTTFAVLAFLDDARAGLVDDFLTAADRRDFVRSSDLI